MDCAGGCSYTKYRVFCFDCRMKPSDLRDEDEGLEPSDLRLVKEDEDADEGLEGTTINTPDFIMDG